MSAPKTCPGAAPLQLNCLPANSSRKLASKLWRPCLVILGYWCRPVNSFVTCPLPFQGCEPGIVVSNSGDKGTCQDCGCLQSVSCFWYTVKLTQNVKFWNSLFRIVCWIGENSRIELSQKPIRAQNDNAMLPWFQELIIKQNFPLFMHELPSTMHCECSGGCTASSCLTWGKFLEGIWEPQGLSHWTNNEDETWWTSLDKIGDMFT